MGGGAAALRREIRPCWGTGVRWTAAAPAVAGATAADGASSSVFSGSVRRPVNAPSARRSTPTFSVGTTTDGGLSWTTGCCGGACVRGARWSLGRGGAGGGFSRTCIFTGPLEDGPDARGCEASPAGVRAIEPGPGG